MFANFSQRDYLKGDHNLGIWLLLLFYPSIVYYIYLKKTLNDFVFIFIVSNTSGM